MAKGGYTYAVSRVSGNIWLYDFMTCAPAFDVNWFTSRRWLQHVSCMDFCIGADTFDIGHIVLSDAELEPPKTWHRASNLAIQLGAPTPYVGSDPRIQKLCEREFPITEAELPQYQEYMILTPKKLLDYLEAQRQRLRVLEVDESQVIQRPSEPAQGSFEPVSVFDIWLSGLEEMEVTEAEEIAEAIDAELEKHSAGEVIGTGQTDGQDQHNIAVQNAPGKNKLALACIRRVLKRLKADPATTDIWEQKPDAEDHVEHSL